MTTQQIPLAAEPGIPADPFVVVPSGGVEVPDAQELARVISGTRELAAIVSATALRRLVVSVGSLRWELEVGRDAGSGASEAGANVDPDPCASPDPSTQADPGHPTQGDPGHPTQGDHGHIVTAPLVGAFYRAPAPGRPPFVEVGARVEAGRQIAVIEAMKMMNDVVADRSGVVRQIHAEDAAIVEYGQPLFTIDPG